MSQKFENWFTNKDLMPMRAFYIVKMLGEVAIFKENNNIFNLLF